MAENFPKLEKDRDLQIHDNANTQTGKLKGTSAKIYGTLKLLEIKKEKSLCRSHGPTSLHGQAQVKQQSRVGAQSE